MKHIFPVVFAVLTLALLQPALADNLAPALQKEMAVSDAVLLKPFVIKVDPLPAMLPSMRPMKKMAGAQFKQARKTYNQLLAENRRLRNRVTYFRNYAIRLNRQVRTMNRRYASLQAAYRRCIRSGGNSTQVRTLRAKVARLNRSLRACNVSKNRLRRSLRSCNTRKARVQRELRSCRGF
jgi:predicted RNase H-like nuclease (RuvC/YqgF family)